MKKTYVIMSVFCCLMISLCGCKKASYFEANEIETAEEESGSIEQKADESVKEQELQEEKTPVVYVYIYPKDEYESIVSSSPVQLEDYVGKLNINTASVSELMNLPGIGQTKAEAIVMYRNEHGAFQSVEDLMQIPGIKDGVYSKIADQIYAN